jgi:hypothetical protein
MRRLTAYLLFLVAFALVPSGSAAPDQAGATTRPSLYVSPTGSDSGGCTRAAPCASFDRAYTIARPGTIVHVAGGRYGAMAIRSRPGRRGPKVVFQPAGRAPVTVTGELKVQASHLEIRRMTLHDLEVPREASHVVFRGIRNLGFWLQGPSNISFIGGEVTCGKCRYHPFLVDGGPPDHRPPRNILFDGVFFHDWHAAESGQHTECLQILAGDGITIRNSVFKNCATADGGRGATANLHISWIGRGPKTRDILIENNFFYPSGNHYAINSGDWINLDFRYNSISGPIIVGSGWGDGTPVEFIGNVMRFSECQGPRTGTGTSSRYLYRHNILDGGTCHSTDRNAPSSFVDPTRNLRLRVGAAAINNGDPKSYPRRDIDGEKRPKGGRPDAGADEAR